MPVAAGMALVAMRRTAGVDAHGRGGQRGGGGGMRGLEQRQRHGDAVQQTVAFALTDPLLTIRSTWGQRRCPARAPGVSVSLTSGASAETERRIKRQMCIRPDVDHAAIDDAPPPTRRSGRARCARPARPRAGVAKHRRSPAARDRARHRPRPRRMARRPAATPPCAGRRRHVGATRGRHQQGPPAPSNF